MQFIGAHANNIALTSVSLSVMNPSSRTSEPFFFFEAFFVLKPLATVASEVGSRATKAVPIPYNAWTSLGGFASHSDMGIALSLRAITYGRLGSIDPFAFHLRY